MGRRGPAPTPTAIARARGSWRANRPHEPAPLAGAPDAPERLSQEARIVWAAVTRTIAPGVLTVDNAQTLARYCHAVVRWWKLAEWLDHNDETYTVQDAAGNVRFVRHPNLITYERLGRDLLRMEQEFGLTPAARSCVHVIENEQAKARTVESRPVLKIVG